MFGYILVAGSGDGSGEGSGEDSLSDQNGPRNYSIYYIYAILYHACRIIIWVCLRYTSFDTQR